MRLWHYELIPYLPNSQLVAQWRELNSIFKNQPNHILINYVYEYGKSHLFNYTMKVLSEINSRGIKIKSFKHYDSYFNVPMFIVERPFPFHHDDRYLAQCYFNLQEKFDREQRDFSREQMIKLEDFIKDRFGPDVKVVDIL